MATFNKRQLIAATVLVRLFLLAASAIIVVPTHHSKRHMDSSEDVTKTMGNQFDKKTFHLECSPKYRGYCLNGGKCVRLKDNLVVASFCKSLYGGKRCNKFLRYH